MEIGFWLCAPACREEQSPKGLLVAAPLLPLFIVFFIQTSGHYWLTAVCRHVGRNLLSLQITSSLCLFSLPPSPRTCVVEYVSEWSHILTGHYQRNRLPCWLTEWQMLWVSRCWVTANCQGFCVAVLPSFHFGCCQRGRDPSMQPQLSEKAPRRHLWACQTQEI